MSTCRVHIYRDRTIYSPESRDAIAATSALLYRRLATDWTQRNATTFVRQAKKLEAKIWGLE